MRRIGFLICIVAALIGADVARADPVYVDQGTAWTAAARADYYTHDQGSRLIPLAWLQALKGRDGRPFLADGLSRYGFLPNPGAAADLPVGFHVTETAGSRIVGVTCSGCHTRQVEVGGKAYRIDGGPAFIDFQAFLSDLDKAAGDALASDASFAPMAAAVLNSATPPSAEVARLRQRVEAWYRRFHAFAAGTLPPAGWGLGRLDAVGIIFNRLSGLDVGPPPDGLILDNMKLAEAPVRYPFLWNSPPQNLTDWGGFVENGNDLFALARNGGQALAFADFEPHRVFGPFFSYANSINFDGLGVLENLVKKMGPPRWPREWPLDAALAQQGEKIYQRECSTGCHEKTEVRGLLGTTWNTPVLNVGTDTRQFDELGWRSRTGALAGAGVPFIANRLNDEDFTVHMMFSAVAGSILEHKLGLGGGGKPGDGFGTPWRENGQPASVAASPATPNPAPAPASGQPSGGPTSVTIEPGTIFQRTLNKGEYETRVLEGVWAAAPYLHNGTVPTLAELLKPPAERVGQFKLGPKYDVDNVGVDVRQDGPTRVVTGCNDLNSGNSNCGHDYGTHLSPEDKKALLEYLKTL